MYASFSDDILEDDGAKVRFTYADNSYIEVLFQIICQQPIIMRM